MRLQRVEVQRHIGQARGQDAAAGAAGQVGVQRVAFRHATAVLVDQLAQRDAGRGQLHARLLHPAAHAVAAQPLAAVAALAGEPLGAALQNLAHPEQRLEVVLQRRAGEQAALGDVGRTQARLAALAFDAFDHGRLFTADVGTGAAAQLHFRELPAQLRRGLQLRNGLRQDGPAFGILVAQVDVDGFATDHVRGDQHTFQKAVRVALQIEAVLEGARLAFVNVDRHQPGGIKAPHDAPLAPGRKARATQAAQAGVLQRGHHALGIACATRHVLGQRVAATLAVRFESYGFRSCKRLIDGRHSLI